ncbi:hypothetical protein IEQ34_021001 [Dendrobium chrysotoxum]|uniref:Uncharacterized protein n=1 Tax=Dendrobium chrysotoxum TaxID=161865 RepID=A0AAV7G2X2_DENCH|nr:hypothetical protein IEQ34_021001 [Dendrobium chrysotoxum]
MSATSIHFTNERIYKLFTEAVFRWQFNQYSATSLAKSESLISIKFDVHVVGAFLKYSTGLLQKLVEIRICYSSLLYLPICDMLNARRVFYSGLQELIFIASGKLQATGVRVKEMSEVEMGFGCLRMGWLRRPDGLWVRL